MSHAVQALKAENIVVKPIFITIDPARDTKEQLALYGQNFDASFDMLTGDIKAIDHTKQLFKVYGNKSSDDRGMHDYLLDHSSLIYVMNPRGQFVGYFDHATSSQDMVTKIKAMMQEAH
jgi:protein SCO1/2